LRLYLTQRSHGATWVARDLQKAGWEKARAFVGGWKAWQEAGLPVESKAPVP